MADAALGIDEIKSRADKLKAMYGERDEIYKEITEMYALEDTSLPTDEDIVKVISPDARNKVLGMVRLLTATNPRWSIPSDVNDRDNMESASAVERAASAMWTQAGRVRGRQIEKDVVLAAGLYSMFSIAVKMAADIVTTAEDATQKARAERAYRRTPLLFTVMNPMSCYPLFDDFGLNAHYFKRNLTVSDVISKHGLVAANLLVGEDRTKLIEYNEYWDWQMHAVWIKAGDILCAPHGMPVLPIACKVVEGSDIFESKYQIQPFLYGLDKSGVWKAQNRALTAMFTNTFNVATSPMSIYHANTEGKQAPSPDYSLRGGSVTVGPNEDLRPFERQAIDPALRESNDLARNMIEESTIYSQTLGQPLGGNAPYSMVALLSQAGRLPLVPYQEMCSEGIGEAMQIGLTLLRDIGKKPISLPKYGKTKGNSVRQAGTEEYDPTLYQDDMELQATLDINMPQDERGNAQVAMQVVQAGLMSRGAAMEKYLDIGQPDDEVKAIWAEKYSDVMADTRLQQLIQQAQQQQQPPQGMPQGAPQGMPPQGMPQPQQQPQMTPEMMQQLAQQQGATSGLPMTEPQPAQQEGMPPDLAGMMGGGM